MIIDVVTREEFLPVVEELHACRQELTFLRNLLTSQRWLSRERTLQALDISKVTLWKLTKTNAITHRYEGRRPFYDVYSLRSYMQAHKIDSLHIDQALLKAINQDEVRQ